MTLAELNAMDQRAFVEAVGWAFEHSPWVAERAWAQRPFASLDALHDTMARIVASATYDEQIAVLRAHPDLGTVRLKPDPTGASGISDASAHEQAGAGLDALTREESDRLQALNTAYREKFGFPFLYAVKSSTTPDVLSALERRLPSTRDIEHQEALRQVYRIARFRLEDVVRQP